MSFKFITIFLIAVLNRYSISYQHYDLLQICRTSQPRKLLEELTSYTFQEFPLFYDGDSAVIVDGVFNVSTYQNIDCSFRIKANDNRQSRKRDKRGLFITIRDLKLRYNLRTFQCIDYIRFTFSDDDKTHHMCMIPDQPVRLSDEDGDIKVRIKLDKFQTLLPPEKLRISLVFTAYKECDLYHQFSCTSKCVSSGCIDKREYCISENFVNDGITNCLALGIDEQTVDIVDTDDITNSTHVVLSALTSLILTMALCGLCFVCFKYKCCVFQRRPSATNNTTGNINNHTTIHHDGWEAQSPTEPIGAHTITSVELSDSNLVATAPPLDDKEPPSYTSLFPNK